jgi:diketogulonate reductase-like aldo/keto reductase
VRPAQGSTDGPEMPLLGLGVSQMADGRETEDAVGWALEAGYRHIDTAQAYGNEASVGRALRASGVPREEVFLTTKFFPGSRDPAQEAERSLTRLGVDWIDLYMVHWPQGGPTWAWSGMEQALERGLTRRIGVSNFGVDELDAVIAAGDVAPAVNQVQFSPFSFRRELLATCERNGVALEAYSPLTRGKDLENPVLTEVAERVGRTPAQVLLRWAVQRRIAAIPKSSRRERIVKNAAIFDFALGEVEMAKLDGLDRTGGTGRAVEREWWTLRWRLLGRAGRLVRSTRNRA